jgi:hypothetical protein
VPTPLHTDKMIDDLVDALVSVWTKCELKLRIEAIRNARKTPIICKSCNNEVMNDIDWRNTCKNLVLKKECEVISA